MLPKAIGAIATTSDIPGFIAVTAEKLVAPRAELPTAPIDSGPPRARAGAVILGALPTMVFTLAPAEVIGADATGA